MRILGTVASSSREVPGAPTIGTATNVGSGRAYNNGRADITFTAPTVDGGFPILDYTVTSSPGGFTATGASSPLTVTGLQSGVAYTFTVTARTAIGTGPASAASNSITATTIPQTPTITSATRSSNTVVSIAFTGATGGSALTAVTATSSPSVSITSSGTSSPMTATATYATGTSYTFTITATNANGTTSASSASSAVTPYPAPTIGSWSASTTFPRLNNLYGGAVAVGSSNLVTVGGGNFADSQSLYTYSFNGTSWTTLSGNTGTIFPGMAGDQTTSGGQSLGGYTISGENDYPQTSTYYNSTSNFNWSSGTNTPNPAYNGWAMAWPSNTWSTTSGSYAGSYTWYRTGTGSWSVGVNEPVQGTGVGVYAYGKGYVSAYNAGSTATWYQTAAGGSYTSTTAMVSSNAAWIRLNVVSGALFTIDASYLPYTYRYDSNGTSTAMTAPSVSGWVYPMVAPVGNQLFAFGGKVSGSNTTINYTATVS